MDLASMRNFIVVAELENISQAARELHMAQPPLSRQIRALEAELGVPLFERERRHLHITEEGRFFKRRCEQVLTLVDKSVEQVRQMHGGSGGTLYLGSIQTIATSYLPRWLAGFDKLNPDVRYSLWSANTDDVIDRLEHGLVDLALVRGEVDERRFDSIHIFDEEWIALVHAENPLAAMDTDSVSLERLAEEQLLVPMKRVEEIRRWFDDAGLEMHVLCEFAPLMNAVSMVENGMGVAICPESSAHSLAARPIVMRRIEGCDTVSSVHLIWRRGHELSGAERRFIQYVRDEATKPFDS